MPSPVTLIGPSRRPAFARALTAGLVGLALLGAAPACAEPVATAMAAAAPRADWRGLATPVFDRIDRDDGLPHAVVGSVVRDADGFLWVGTQGGLARFDGYRFRPADGVMTDAFIRALHGRSDGTLWVGSNADGLAVLDIHDGTWRRWTAAEQGLASDRVNAIVEDGTGGLWIGTQAGLQHLDPVSGALTAVPTDSGPLPASHAEKVATLLATDTGDLWIGTAAGLVRRTWDGGLIGGPVQDSGEGWPSAAILALAQDKAGRIWVGTATEGLWLLAPDGLPHNRVTALAEVGPDQIWVGTYGGGIAILDPATGAMRVARHNGAIPSSLSGDAVTELYRDPSGLVWVGTAGNGLDRHNPANDAISTIAYSPDGNSGPSRANVLSVLATGDGRLWLGTAGAGIDVLDHRKGRVDAIRPAGGDATGGLGDGAVMALAEGLDGSVWIGTQRGLYRRPPGSSGTVPVQMDGPPELRDGQIYAIRPQPDGSAWIGGGRGVFHIAADGTVTLWRAEEGLAASEVNSVLRDREGRIWLATDGGLDRLDPATGRIEHAALDPDGKPLLVSTLLQDRAGRIWAGTLGGGLALSAPAGREMPAFIRLGKADGLPSGNIGALATDRQGRIWASTDDGLAVIDPDTLAVRRFGPGDGVVVREYWLNAVTTAPDGTIAFGGSGGVTLVRPDDLRDWTFSPPVRLTELTVGGQPLPAEPFNAAQAGPLVIHPGERSFMVEFAALDLARPARNRYSVRLAGFEEGWDERDGTRRTATWTSLPPGDYTLEIRAANKDGRWAEAAFTLPVRVMPAWWQYRWVQAMALLALAGLGYGLYRGRTAYLHARRKELELLVANRTVELARQKDELERTLCDLRAAQEEIVRSEKLAALGRMVAGVAHEINTPVGLVITSVTQLEEEIREVTAKLEEQTLRRSDLSEFLEMARELSDVIARNSDRAADLVQSFKQVSADRASEERRTVQLTPYLSEVVKTIRPLVRLRGVDIRVSGPEAVSVTTYPGLLAQVVTNLVTNAVTHAFAGVAEPEILLDIAAHGDGARIVLADNGNGMGAEVRDRAFEPFFTTRRNAGGTGLGLHIVHNLVTGPLRGGLSLDTAPGRGTRFQIDLPAHV